MERPAVCLALATLLAAAPAHAQQPMGSVPTRDARITGGLEVQGDRATLLSNASITAYDRTAAIDLQRGGRVLVCSTSQFHLLHAGTGAALLFGLDRGAIELRGPADANDTLLTPDLRFQVTHTGAFDLRLRVTPNGDTCVDNAGPHAPTLLLSDPFSPATYRLIPGQHVLFEHGSLRAVVDNERSPCGCPAPTPEAATNPNGKPDHPFPAAVSEGLANPDPAPPNNRPGETTTQVSATLAYGTAADAPPGLDTPPPSPAPPAAATPPPPPPAANGLAHKIRHFFYKLFHPHEAAQAQ